MKTIMDVPKMICLWTVWLSLTLLSQKVHKNINSLLETMQWEKDSVGLFALHQANVFMVNYIRKKLKVRAEVTPTNVTNYGNTGPATIPLLFSDLCSRQV